MLLLYSMWSVFPQGLQRTKITLSIYVIITCALVAEVYGVWMYAVLLFLLTLWWAAHWGDASACPYIHLEAYLDGSSTFSDSLLASLAELAGGLAIYR